MDETPQSSQAAPKKSRRMLWIVILVLILLGIFGAALFSGVLNPTEDEISPTPTMFPTATEIPATPTPEELSPTVTLSPTPTTRPATPTPTTGGLQSNPTNTPTPTTGSLTN